MSKLPPRVHLHRLNSRCWSWDLQCLCWYLGGEEAIRYLHLLGWNLALYSWRRAGGGIFLQSLIFFELSVLVKSKHWVLWITLESLYPKHVWSAVCWTRARGFILFQVSWALAPLCNSGFLSPCGASYNTLGHVVMTSAVSYVPGFKTTLKVISLIDSSLFLVSCF